MKSALYGLLVAFTTAAPSAAVMAQQPPQPQPRQQQQQQQQQQPQQQQQATFTVRSLTPEAALRAAQAALQSCARTGYQVAIAVSDRAGHPLVMLRDRLAGPHTAETAINKAYTAVTFKMDTLAFARATQASEGSSGIRQLPRVVAIGGGLPIESAGALVGGIGVSGAPGGEADDVCARAGVAAIKDDLDF